MLELVVFKAWREWATVPYIHKCIHILAGMCAHIVNVLICSDTCCLILTYFLRQSTNLSACLSICQSAVRVKPSEASSQVVVILAFARNGLEHLLVDHQGSPDQRPEEKSVNLVSTCCGQKP